MHAGYSLFQLPFPTLISSVLSGAIEVKWLNSWGHSSLISWNPPPHSGSVYSKEESQAFHTLASWLGCPQRSGIPARVKVLELCPCIQELGCRPPVSICMRMRDWKQGVMSGMGPRSHQSWGPLMSQGMALCVMLA